MFPTKPPVANKASDAISYLSKGPGKPEPGPAHPRHGAVASTEDAPGDPTNPNDGSEGSQDVYGQVESLVDQFGADEVQAALDRCRAQDSAVGSGTDTDLTAV